MSGIGALRWVDTTSAGAIPAAAPTQQGWRNDRGDQPGRVYDVGAVPMAPTPSP